jgi:ceramide glucosyltransferase
MVILATIFGLLSLSSLTYVGYSIYRVAKFGRRTAPRGAELPPVTVLKPVCGLDAGLYENLRSFCVQDYPDYQLVFSASEADDPAVSVVRRIIEEFPGRDIDLVIDSYQIGSNRKISNIANGYKQARHDLLVIADSDMRVNAGYLRTIVSAFGDEKVGAVTCLYKGRPARQDLASRLGSALINEWFLPSVLVAAAFRDIRFCFGATMAVRREVLERIGGFPVLATVLADDYMLGKLVSELGYRIELSPYVVENVVSEPGIKALFRHELRWARTVNSVQPMGYAFSIVTQALPVSLLYLAVTAASWPSVAVVGAAVSLRVLMQYVNRRSLHIRESLQPWLVPVRDLLSFAVWTASFFGNTVSWRTHSFTVDNGGQMILNERKESL